MQGLVARGLTLEEIWNVDVNYVEVTAAKIQVKVSLRSQYIEEKHFARNIGQGHPVKVPAKSVH